MPSSSRVSADDVSGFYIIGRILFLPFKILALIMLAVVFTVVVLIGFIIPPVKAWGDWLAGVVLPKLYDA